MDHHAATELLETAIVALGKSTGLRAHFEHIDRDRIGAKLTITAPGGKRTKTFNAEIKNTLSSSAIAQIATLAGKGPGGVVLVAEYVSALQGEKLRALNIPYFDTAGNAFFNERGFYVLSQGRKQIGKREKTPGIYRPQGMKLIFAFLTQRGLEQESYRAISMRTGVPTPTVGVFMADLKKAGFLTQRIQPQRQLVRRDELLKRFVEHYTEGFRQTLNPVRFRSTKSNRYWWRDLDISQFDAYWGGETGGAKLTKHLHPEAATIYADSLLPQLQAKYGLIRDEEGDTEILRRFWKTGEVGDVAPPLVVYADLIGNADRRSIETAELIYDRYLAELTETTP